jgi:4-amino-4-deoxy-L-arabinose transferase-like glycosyltransferase
MIDQAAPLTRQSSTAPSRALLLGLLGLTLFRLWAAATIPLTEDEAYYRLWAASPQFGYFDHPPMIAWWIALGRFIAGDTPLGVRLIPALSSLVTSLAAFDLALRLGWSRVIAERTALWCNATLLVGVGGVLAVPDAATTPFWTLTLCALARTSGRRAWAWWMAAGVAAGLACLSKYSALFLAPGVLVWLAVTPGGLRRLRTPGPWLAMAFAAAIFSINVIWNAEHHWLTFAKQFGRAAPGRFAPRYLIELLVGQALLLNPAVFVVRALGSERARLLRLPLATGAPFVVYLALHALHDRVQAHWPVPIYPALALCAAVAADDSLLGAGAKPILKGLRGIAAPLGLGLSALVLLHLALPGTDIRGLKDPAQAVRGWPAFGAAVETLRLDAGAGWVGVVSYGLDGELADQPAIAAPIAQLNERARYPSADRSWGADLSRPGLVVDLTRRLDPDLLRRCFARVTALGPLPRAEGLTPDSRYSAFVVAGPRVDVLNAGCPSHGGAPSQAAP